MFDIYSGIVSEAIYKTKHGKGLHILTSKQMLQRLPIALAQVKAGNTSNKIYWTKEITKKVYNNIMNSRYNIKNEYYIYEFRKQ